MIFEEKKIVSAVVFSVVLILLIVSSFFVIKYHEEERGTRNKNLHKEKALISSPSELFLNDVRMGCSTTTLAKTHAYNFVSLYVNNGGNIYEIYDFVNEHEELAFLRVAESLYPEIFQQIKERDLPFTYSDQGLYAFLAYLEILDVNGYGGIAVDGTLSYYYSKFAYYMLMIIEDKKRGESLDYPAYSKEEIKKVSTKAVTFMRQADREANDILLNKDMAGKISSISDFIGLIQYATALRYYNNISTPFLSKVSPEEIFSFVSQYARRGGVPDMYFTGVLYDASTRVLAKKVDKVALEKVVMPLTELQAKSIATLPIVKEIIASKYHSNTYRFADLGVTSYKTTRQIALYVPAFKAWLENNGWYESDFK